MPGKKSVLLVISIFILSTSACNVQTTQTEPQLRQSAPTQNLIPTQITEPVSTQPQANLPQTDAEVPRVPVDQAKAAFESGEAVIVDVRSSQAYAVSHVAGAINIQLSEIETNPASLNLDKDQWIITYCT